MGGVREAVTEARRIVVKVGSSSLTTTAGVIDEQRVDALAEVSGRDSARQVGTIMARHGGAVPWHRVVTSSGRLPPGHEQEARQRLLADGVPLRGDRVDMRAAWSPG